MSVKNRELFFCREYFSGIEEGALTPIEMEILSTIMITQKLSTNYFHQCNSIQRIDAKNGQINFFSLFMMMVTNRIIIAGFIHRIQRSET